MSTYRRRVVFTSRLTAAILAVFVIIGATLAASGHATQSTVSIAIALMIICLVIARTAGRKA